MKNSRHAELMTKAISPVTVKVDGLYTVPRTYGVYRLVGKERSGRAFRYGNHPVRMAELVTEFGKVELVALFMERRFAMELAAIENSFG